MKQIPTVLGMGCRVNQRLRKYVSRGLDLGSEWERFRKAPNEHGRAVLRLNGSGPKDQAAWKITVINDMITSVDF